jgi:hypothetical protein
LYLLFGGHAPTPEARAATKAYVQRFRAALRPYLRSGVWMNFMNGNGSGARERIKEAYLPESYERLLALKAKYDPGNLFRYSYQLVPSETAEA